LKEAGLRRREVLFVYDLEAWCAFIKYEQNTCSEDFVVFQS
jgi:hypothetical protein